ncbi:hypothetical protein GUITHDRAFT_160029 [Guillardia theta CCMP2712]|uniref:Fumarylacetoacetase-like C-terminal domain-containing protein n=1 Tax=Guillardia theta (strain CCMP2712) TaxID=905079 RepID=L1ISM7_GUITC|nr:hypothetical protein GUITHDRAFT_160029 [Guillardia theta CCMP2712]EKX39112.1 hypothetical protein GUITHDRAFT_160029 [Guillardia theta CCMP2712]|eukprot:XP_005826092.1 hypothetical protein GUITHDRAFT_160029 [Guillardia theta CCMP2712]
MAGFVGTGKKIVAIGRNYVKHAMELNNPVPSEPFWFLKPTTSYVTAGKPVIIPRGVDEIHHEVELGVVIGRGGKNIKSEEALSHVAGYCLAFDMTVRTWQDKAKQKGLPWTACKGFDSSLPVGSFLHKDLVKDPSNLTLWCKVNQVERQRGSTSLMIFPIPQLISAISSVHTLEEGDLILTGTPEGVGPVRRGDVLQGGIEELDVKVEFQVE